MTKEKILQQGAEAIIIRQDDNIIKRRIKKGYRLDELDDKIRKRRTRSEAKLLEKAGKLISVPEIIKVDEKSNEIAMQFIEGKRLSDWLDSFEEKKAENICIEIGKSVAKLHDSGIIHGDLTTSNMILAEAPYPDKKDKQNNHKKLIINNPKELANSSEMLEHEESMKEANFKIFFIDFGLSFHSSRAEDKAVDLHLLRQALEAKHFTRWQQLFDSVLKGYNESKNSEQVLSQLKKVEARGRYKH